MLMLPSISRAEPIKAVEMCIRDSDKGEVIDELDIPADMVELAEKYRHELLEAVAETDEELMMKYLESEELSEEEIKSGLRKATIANQLNPVVCGTSYKNKGCLLYTSRTHHKNEKGEPFERLQMVISNHFVDAAPFLPFEPIEAGIREKVHYPTLRAILDEGLDSQALKERLIEEKDRLVPMTVYLEDIIASVNYGVNLCGEYGNVDDIDHLGNRRVRCVGELLQNQLRVGFSRMAVSYTHLFYFF